MRRRCFLVETQSGLSSFGVWTMASIAVVGENRPDFPVVIDMMSLGLANFLGIPG